jgi:hypothetical protein
MKIISGMALAALAGAGLWGAATSCLQPPKLPVPLPLIGPKLAVPASTVRMWVIVFPGGTTSCTQDHATAHKVFDAHPGSHVWQVSLPQTVTASSTLGVGTGLFGIVLCK